MAANTHPKPVEETMKLSDAKQQFSKVINRVARGEARVIVEKSGLPVAVIDSIGNYQPSTTPDTELQGETLYQLVQGGYISADDLSGDEEMDIAVYLVRMERLNHRARELAGERIEARARAGESLTEGDRRQEYVQAMREVRADFLARSADR